jgi:hypothetical protein
MQRLTALMDKIGEHGERVRLINVGSAKLHVGDCEGEC